MSAPISTSTRMEDIDFSISPARYRDLALLALSLDRNQGSRIAGQEPSRAYAVMIAMVMDLDSRKFHAGASTRRVHRKQHPRGQGSAARAVPAVPHQL